MVRILVIIIKTAFSKRSTVPVHYQSKTDKKLVGFLMTMVDKDWRIDMGRDVACCGCQPVTVASLALISGCEKRIGQFQKEDKKWNLLSVQRFGGWRQKISVLLLEKPILFVAMYPYASWS